MEETELLSVPSVETEWIWQEERKKVWKAAEQLLKSGSLTEIQQRRFRQYYFQGLLHQADRQTGRGSPAGHVGQFGVGGKEAEKILYEGQLMLYDTDEQGRLVWFSLLVCMWEMNVVRMYRGGKTFDSGKAGEWERQIIKIKIILMM